MVWESAVLFCSTPFGVFYLAIAMAARGRRETSQPAARHQMAVALFSVAVGVIGALVGQNDWGGNASENKLGLSISGGTSGNSVPLASA